MNWRATQIVSPLVAGWLLCVAGLSGADAADRKSASVPVTIRIAPIAYIDFPDGFDFVITVPEAKKGKGHDKGKGKGHDDHGNGKGKGHDDGVVIKPVLIPFKVVGNAVASISAKPDAFMRVYRGPWLGEAVKQGGDRHKNQQGKGHDKGKGNGHAKGHGGTLGYNVIVQFPIQSWHYAHLNGWDGLNGGFRAGFASLPGLNGAGTPPLTANVAGRRHGAYGMIHIVARQLWTKDGKDATPGKYWGSLEVTLTADGQ